MYADDLVVYSESEEDLRVTVGLLLKVCRRRGLKVNADKSNVMVLNGEESLEYEIYVNRIHLRHFLEFICFGVIRYRGGKVW